MLALVLMSSDARLKYVAPTWSLAVEHNSGAMDDAAAEAKALSQWKTIATPWFQRATSDITKAISRLSKDDEAWRLLVIDSPEKRAFLPRVYEERVDARSAPAHEKRGNRECTFVMRFHPPQVSGVVFIELVLKRLPSRSTREALAQKLGEGLAKIPWDPF